MRTNFTNPFSPHVELAMQNGTVVVGSRPGETAGIFSIAVEKVPDVFVVASAEMIAVWDKELAAEPIVSALPTTVNPATKSRASFWVAKKRSLSSIGILHFITARYFAATVL